MTETGTEARVCELIARRQQVGINKYGTTVEANPLSLLEWMKHHRDELADALVYVQRQIEMLEGIPGQDAAPETATSGLTKAWEEHIEMERESQQRAAERDQFLRCHPPTTFTQTLCGVPTVYAQIPGYVREPLL